MDNSEHLHLETAVRSVDFDIFSPPGAREDFHGAWKQLQDEAGSDLVWTDRNGGHWIATDGPLIKEMLADSVKFSSRVIFIPKQRGEHYNMLPITLDPPHHQPFRNLLNPGLSPSAVHNILSDIRDLSIGLIDGIKSGGNCDFVTAYSEIFPLRILMRLTGLPEEDAPLLKSWADNIARPQQGSMSLPEVVEAFTGYLTPILRERKTADGQDLLSRIAHGQIRGRPITDEEVIQMCIQTLVAGLDTVVNTLSFIMLFLARNPEHRRALAADPALIPAGVDELMRRFGIVAIAREVIQDITYHGAYLKKGEMIILPTQLHGLDEDVNKCPLDVDFHRVKVEHSAFGNGRHSCPGRYLALHEIRITLEEWLARIPDFEVPDDVEITFSAGAAGSVDSLPLKWKI